VISTCRRSLAIAFAALLLATGFATRDAQAHPDGSYPRTFNLDWTNDPDAFRDSKYDMVSLSARAAKADFDSIKALNPSSIRLVVPAWYTYYYAGPSGYPQTSGPWSVDDPFYGYDRKYWNLINDNGWWAWAVDSSGVRYHASTYWGVWLGNFSTSCPPNAQGKRLCDVFADFVIDELVSKKGADGVFFDHLWDGPSWLNWNMGGCRTLPDCSEETPGTKYRTAFDLNGDYVPDTWQQMDGAWKAGVEVVFARMRQRMGNNFVIMGNGQHHYADANGAMSERFPRLHGNLDSGYNPLGFRWQDSMFSPIEGYLNAWKTIYRQPIRTVLDTEYSSPSRYEYPTDELHQRLYRFNLASTLLGDGYHTMNNGTYGCWFWQKEYDLRLGWPVGPAYPVTVQGVNLWRRDFSNGEVWVNPTEFYVTISSTNPAMSPWDGYMRQKNGSTAVDPSPAMPLSFAHPTPNPTSSDGTAALLFSLAPDEPGRMDILDLKGRLVRELWSGVGTGQTQTALWDGRTDQGWIAPAGVYYAMLEGVSGRSVSRKIVRVP
jgi:hypothetical protein